MCPSVEDMLHCKRAVPSRQAILHARSDTDGGHGREMLAVQVGKRYTMTNDWNGKNVAPGIKGRFIAAYTGGGGGMKRCYQCQKELVLNDPPQSRDVCRHCGAVLRCCLNCRNYSPDARQECRLDLPLVENKKAANLCGKFIFREFFSQHRESVQETARKRINDLFRNL